MDRWESKGIIRRVWRSLVLKRASSMEDFIILFIEDLFGGISGYKFNYEHYTERTMASGN